MAVIIAAAIPVLFPIRLFLPELTFFFEGNGTGLSFPGIMPHGAAMRSRTLRAASGGGLPAILDRAALCGFRNLSGRRALVFPALRASSTGLRRVEQRALGCSTSEIVNM